MADYKDIFGRLAGKVREAADSSGVLDVYVQGTERAKALGERRISWLMRAQLSICMPMGQGMQ